MDTKSFASQHHRAAGLTEQQLLNNPRWTLIGHGSSSQVHGPRSGAGSYPHAQTPGSRRAAARPRGMCRDRGPHPPTPVWAARGHITPTDPTWHPPGPGTAAQERIVCGWTSLPLPEWLLWWVEASVSLPHSVVRQRVSTKTHLLKLWMSLSLILPKKTRRERGVQRTGGCGGAGWRGHGRGTARATSAAAKMSDIYLLLGLHANTRASASRR